MFRTYDSEVLRLSKNETSGLSRFAEQNAHLIIFEPYFKEPILVYLLYQNPTYMSRVGFINYFNSNEIILLDIY